MEQLTSRVAPEQAASDLDAAIASKMRLVFAASLYPSGVAMRAKGGHEASDWSIIDVGAGTGLVLSLSLYLSLARSRSRALSLSLSLCVCRSLSLSLPHTLSCSLSLSRSLSLSMPPSLSAPTRNAGGMP